MECPCFLCSGLDPVLALSILTSAVAIHSFDFQKYACAVLEFPWRDSSEECNRSDLRWFELLTKCYITPDSGTSDVPEPRVPHAMHPVAANHLSFLYSSDASDCDVFGTPIGYPLPRRKSLPPLPALILRFAYESGLFHPSLIGIPCSTKIPETSFKRQQSLSDISTAPTDQSRTPPTPSIPPCLDAVRVLNGDTFIYSEQDMNGQSPYRPVPFPSPNSISSGVVLSESAFANRTAFSIKLPSIISIIEHHRSRCIFFSKRDVAAFSCPNVPSTLVRMITCSSAWLELYITIKTQLRQHESTRKAKTLDITYIESETAKHLRNRAAHEFAKLHFQKIHGRWLKAEDYDVNKSRDYSSVFNSNIASHAQSPKPSLTPQPSLPHQPQVANQPPQAHFDAPVTDLVEAPVESVAAESHVDELPIEAEPKYVVEEKPRKIDIGQIEDKELQPIPPMGLHIPRTPYSQKTANMKNKRKKKDKISKQLQGKLLSIPLPPSKTRIHSTKTALKISPPQISPPQIIPPNLLHQPPQHLLQQMKTQNIPPHPPSKCQVPSNQQQVKKSMLCPQARSYTPNYALDPPTLPSRSATTSNVSPYFSYPNIVSFGDSQLWKIQYPSFNEEPAGSQYMPPMSVVLFSGNPSPPKYGTYPSNEPRFEKRSASRRSIEAIQEAIDSTSFKPQQQTIHESTQCSREFSCKRQPCYWPSCTDPHYCPTVKECTALQFDDICSQVPSKHLPPCAECRPARVPPHIWYPFTQSGQVPPSPHPHTPWGEESCRDYCDTGGSCGKSADQRVVLVFGFLMDFLATTRHVNRMELVNPTRFHGVTVPKASVLQYCRHLQCSGQMQPETFVVAYVYVNRILEKHINIINSLTVHRFVVGLLVVAAKFFEDVFLTNKAFSQFCGIQAQELNQLEELILKMLKWNLYVNEEEYENSRRFLSGVGVMEYLITGSFLADHASKIPIY